VTDDALREQASPAASPLSTDQEFIPGVSHSDSLPQVAVFGEVLFDHFPDGSRVLGGAPFNVAWHLQGFGVDARLLSGVGEGEAGGPDREGGEVLKRISGWGLATEGVQRVSGRATGRVVVDIVEGEPRFTIPPDQAWDHLEREPVAAALGDASLLYHGSLAIRGEGNWRLLQEMIRRSGASTFVDLNLRAPWWTMERARWCLSSGTWVKLNADELAQLTGAPTGSLEECRLVALALAREHGIPRLIVTRGGSGAMEVEDGERVLTVDASRVEQMEDTVGAGDAFSAVRILGILRGWEPSVALERAARFAADVCGQRGATLGDLTLYARHVRDWANEGRGRTGGAGDGRPGLYVLSLSVHGLVRGEEIELGRDPDTGGQVSYAVDQARALARRPEVEEVELITRLVADRRVDPSYAVPREEIAPGAAIVRLPFGPRRYLRKETLWPHMDSLLDQLTRHVRTRGRLPDVIHGHYADAGYVGGQLARLLGVPFVFTGHSLGRVKRRRLLEEEGADPDLLEERYHISARIEAEERALETAALVIASTRQEVESQYEEYDHYRPASMEVIPPGVDLDRFGPPPLGWRMPPVADRIRPFLRDLKKPIILAIARPDERKNFRGLLHAYGGNAELRERANLVLVAGNREEIRDLSGGARRVVNRILELVDRYDLYGSVAYPKQHSSEDIPDLYRMASRSRGIFVNPSLTEPFGLTLLEAAASGLPVVATRDGGPRDILQRCQNGVLVDPLDHEALGEAMLEAISSRRRWGQWAKKGLAGVHESFSWSAHARSYVAEVQRIQGGVRPAVIPASGTRMPTVDRLLVTDVDDTLTGDLQGLAELRSRLEGAGPAVGFGIATGRSLWRTLELLEELRLPPPDLLVTASGAEIHHGGELIPDRSWQHQIRYRWDPDGVERALAGLPGLERRWADRDTPYRLRYRRDPERGPSLTRLQRTLRQSGLQATTILDHASFLDVLPVRASPGLAIRFFCFKWGLPPHRVLVAGDSGNDRDMLSGETLGVVVANHTPELEELRGRPRVHFARGRHAWGVVEAMDRFDFTGDFPFPREEDE